MTTALTIFFVVLAVFIGFLIRRGIVTVRQAEVMVIERLGQFNRVLHAGIHPIIPGIEKKRFIEWRYLEYDPEGRQVKKRIRTERIDLRETLLDFPKQNVITKDNVIIEINALLFFQITDPIKVVYEIENLLSAIEKLTQTTLRNILGEMELDQTFRSRDLINNKLRDVLDENTDNWGVKITRVELQDINPPAEVRDDMEMQLRAERQRRASVTQSEGYRDSEINKGEGDKRAKSLRADADAYSKLRVAQAEAESIRKIADALKSRNCDPTQYLIAMRYIETLKEIASGNGKVVFLPYEATGVLGSLGTIKELFKDMTHQQGEGWESTLPK